MKKMSINRAYTVMNLVSKGKQVAPDVIVQAYETIREYEHETIQVGVKFLLKTILGNVYDVVVNEDGSRIITKAGNKLSPAEMIKIQRLVNQKWSSKVGMMFEGVAQAIGLTTWLEDKNGNMLSIGSANFMSPRDNLEGVNENALLALFTAGSDITDSKKRRKGYSKPIVKARVMRVLPMIWVLAQLQFADDGVQLVKAKSHPIHKTPLVNKMIIEAFLTSLGLFRVDFEELYHMESYTKIIAELSNGLICLNTTSQSVTEMSNSLVAEANLQYANGETNIGYSIPTRVNGAKKSDMHWIEVIGADAAEKAMAFMQELARRTGVTLKEMEPDEGVIVHTTGVMPIETLAAAGIEELLKEYFGEAERVKTAGKSQEKISAAETRRVKQLQKIGKLCIFDYYVYQTTQKSWGVEVSPLLQEAVAYLKANPTVWAGDFNYLMIIKGIAGALSVGLKKAELYAKLKEIGLLTSDHVTSDKERKELDKFINTLYRKPRKAAAA